MMRMQRWVWVVCLAAGLLAISAAAEEAAVVKKDRVRVRAQAALTSEVITLLKKGETVTVLEEITPRKHKRGEPAKWARIQLPPNTPVWVSDNGADVTTLYRGDIPGTPVTQVPLVVSIPGGAPTGQVFNDTTAFTVPGTGKPALFIFAGEDGDLSAWNQLVAPLTSAVAVGHTEGAVYKGLALVHSQAGPRLLAANFHDNRIDVFDGQFTMQDTARDRQRRHAIA